MTNEIVAFYSIIDDLLKSLEQCEDCSHSMSNTEVITAAVVATRYLGTSGVHKATTS